MVRTPQYDELYDQQNEAATDAERKTLIDQMQQLFYDQAPYHVLYYDDDAATPTGPTSSAAGRTSRPTAALPFFAYGSIDYTLLTDAERRRPRRPSPRQAPAPRRARRAVRRPRRRRQPGAQPRQPVDAASGSTTPLL